MNARVRDAGAGASAAPQHRRPWHGLTIAGAVLMLGLLGCTPRAHAAGGSPLVLAETGGAAAPQTSLQEHAGEQHAAGTGAEAEHEGPSWGVLALKWTNFLLLVAILYWLLVVPPQFVIENFEFVGLRRILATRARSILEARELARRQRAQAQQQLQESEKRLAQVEQEVAALVEEARQAAAAERQRLEAAAVEEADKIRSGAARDLNAQLAAARRRLRARTADLAVGIAGALLRENFTPEDQDRLMQEYLERLGRGVA